MSDPDWEKDSPRLRKNLRQALLLTLTEASRREKPTLEAAREWQRLIMRDLSVPNARYVGAFRGEAGLENLQVRVGANYGVASADVAKELALFEAKLQSIVAELDGLLPVGHEPDADELAAIVDVCAWAHAEWVRIHPFANGNGRTARLWANSLALRYGLPPFVRLLPRPNVGYAEAGAKAMRGDWEPTAAAFRTLLEDFLKGS
ncbi:MAG TPA: Fic family protein [Candidatus Baltobacteraceae bacterium]|nr:Fic family protein [Candidatus Baltobacteraceae bacterium]